MINPKLRLIIEIIFEEVVPQFKGWQEGVLKWISMNVPYEKQAWIVKRVKAV